VGSIPSAGSMNRKLGILIRFFLIIVFLFFVSHLFSNKQKSPLVDNPYNLRFLIPPETEGDYIKSQMNTCWKNNSNGCREQLAEILMEQFEYKKLLRLIEENQSAPEVFSKCHELVHYLGRNAYADTPDIKSLYEYSAPTCWGGFYHGVIEGYFDKNPYRGDEEFAEDIRKVCGIISDYSVPHFFSECTHGIGHAMMFVSSGDLLKSLTWCDKLPTLETRSMCYGGVFMENSSSSTVNSMHTSEFIKEGDPMYPCNSLPEQYLNICYSYQSSYFAQLVNSDWKKNGDLCSQVPSAYHEGCFRVIGSNQVGFTKVPKDMGTNCGFMPTEKTKKFCFYGVISGLAGRYINEPEMLIEFCSNLEEKYREDCFTAIGSSMRVWSSDKRPLQTFCETSNKKYTYWCEKGLNSTFSTSPFITN